MMKEKYQDLKDWEESETRKTEILTGIKEAVDEVKLIKSGKLKAKSLKEILDEL